MKTALLYTFWTGDDVEMLKRSIQHNGLFVDRIIVFYQKTSNTGNFNENLFNFFSFNNLIIERKNYSFPHLFSISLQPLETDEMPFIVSPP
jgi:hypothetical protein